MKILALDQIEHPGGAEMFFAELLKELGKEHSIHLIHGRSKTVKELYKKDNTKKRKYSIQFYPFSIPSLKSFISPRFFKFFSTREKLLKKIVDIKPDIILSNTVRTHFYSSGLGKKLQIPLVWLGHDFTFPQGILAKTICTPEAIITCSAAVKDHYHSIYPQLKKYVFPPIGFQEKQLSNNLKDLLKNKKNTIGFVGHFSRWKGHLEFLKLASALKDDFPEYRFEILGKCYPNKSDSKRYYKECLDFIEENKLQNIVKIDHHSGDIVNRISHWKVLIHASKQKEPFGRVIVEGFAAACTVLASNSGGPLEIIDEGKNGVLWDPKNTQSGFEKIRTLLTHEKARESIASLAFEKAKKEYLWSVLAKKHSNSYHEVIKKYKT